MSSEKNHTIKTLEPQGRISMSYIVVVSTVGGLANKSDF